MTTLGETLLESAQETYSRLVEPIERRMASVIGRIVPREEDALDVLQEVLGAVWAGLPRIDRHPNPHALILRMCLNRSIDSLRRSQRARRRLEKYAEGAADPAAAPPQERSERAEAVRAALCRLSAGQARAVALRAMDGLDYSEIATILGCRETTARSHYSKGMARLGRILAGMGFGEVNRR